MSLVLSSCIVVPHCRVLHVVPLCRELHVVPHCKELHVYQLACRAPCALVPSVTHKGHSYIVNTAGRLTMLMDWTSLPATDTGELFTECCAMTWVASYHIIAFQAFKSHAGRRLALMAHDKEKLSSL